jgi:selenide,water dikinase
VQHTPAIKDLVLIGGGHAHLSVLRRFAMRPLPGVRLTLVSRTSQSPYSGMLPGFIAGHYTDREMHFDLRALAHRVGCRFILAEVTGLDPAAGRVQLADRCDLEFDLLSLNTGSTPAMPARLIDDTRFTPVKPIDAFARRWQAIEHRVLSSNDACHLGIIGGGAGGIELVLAMQHRLHAARQAQGAPADTLTFTLLCAEDGLLPGHNRAARAAFARILAERGVAVQTSARVEEVEGKRVSTADGRAFCFDEILWVTSAAPAAWFRKAGLGTDEHGYVKVGTDLRSVSHPGIFAAGDCASIEGHPRPKAGVHAVRQGAWLAENLQRVLLGRPLRHEIPQRQALAILATGPRHAVATRGPWSVQGRWVWRWKDFIDRRFMRKFQSLPAPMAAGAQPASVALHEELSALGPLEGRCGGCGAKVAAQTLRSALGALAGSGAHVTMEDAAVSEFPAGQVAVQSMDGFRSFIDDPWLFGQITAAHALSDLQAMGATPHSALAYVTLPVNGEALTRRDLTQLLAGAQTVLRASGAALVGGHTAEGAEMSLALSVTGFAARECLRPKRAPHAGDVLILTKALGTGVLLAAHMQGRSFSPWIDAALQAMCDDNACAARLLSEYTVHALTDVTGFGLAGHLGEMLEESGLVAEVELCALPVLAGALEMLAAGVRSTLHARNAKLPASIALRDTAPDPARYDLLFDPQTSGGLLAALPAHEGSACLRTLQEAGCVAAIIGTVRAH